MPLLLESRDKGVHLPNLTSSDPEGETLDSAIWSRCLITWGRPASLRISIPIVISIFEVEKLGDYCVDVWLSRFLSSSKTARQTCSAQSRPFYKSLAHTITTAAITATAAPGTPPCHLSLQDSDSETTTAPAPSAIRPGCGVAAASLCRGFPEVEPCCGDSVVEMWPAVDPFVAGGLAAASGVVVTMRRRVKSVSIVPCWRGGGAAGGGGWVVDVGDGMGEWVVWDEVGVGLLEMAGLVVGSLVDVGPSILLDVGGAEGEGEGDAEVLNTPLEIFDVLEVVSLEVVLLPGVVVMVLKVPGDGGGSALGMLAEEVRLEPALLTGRDPGGGVPPGMLILLVLALEENEPPGREPPGVVVMVLSVGRGMVAAIPVVVPATTTVARVDFVRASDGRNVALVVLNGDVSAVTDSGSAGVMFSVAEEEILANRPMPALKPALEIEATTKPREELAAMATAGDGWAMFLDLADSADNSRRFR